MQIIYLIPLVAFVAQAHPLAMPEEAKNGKAVKANEESYQWASDGGYVSFYAKDKKAIAEKAKRENDKESYQWASDGGYVSFYTNDKEATGDKYKREDEVEGS
ncbi:hypothetical protein CB0940_06512 [Cercospora beticola]|uniref:Uncharacterized protein n=1 Tax=Cercospora beticola TaxID=122368 RepID=A0A2G5HYW7_CERBT|nr:hypothetical protein CB0940_06512 [Cercospora beticola]PIA97729.1 hypothetical protein CB0940_06512 [Cercospora beticola]WPA99150.1 hypothetical protein RHO25_003766 [Cercospora beticola]